MKKIQLLVVCQIYYYQGTAYKNKFFCFSSLFNRYHRTSLTCYLTICQALPSALHILTHLVLTTNKVGTIILCILLMRKLIYRKYKATCGAKIRIWLESVLPEGCITRWGYSILKSIVILFHIKNTLKSSFNFLAMPLTTLLHKPSSPTKLIKLS